MRGSAGPPTAASRTLSQNRQTGRRSGETLRSGQPPVASIERVSRANSPRGAAMLLSPPANVRYRTGAHVLGVRTAGTFARYCLVPAEGAPILFEYKGSVHVSQKVVGDVRPAYTWQYGGVAARDKAREWAQSIRSALRELGLEHERLAVDRLDATGFLALQDEKIPIVEVLPATVDAREVKTAEEVQLFEINGGIG